MTAEVLRGMINDGSPVIEFRSGERTLEDAFIDILGRLERGRPAVDPPPSAGG